MSHLRFFKTKYLIFRIVPDSNLGIDLDVQRVNQDRSTSSYVLEVYKRCSNLVRIGLEVSTCSVSESSLVLELKKLWLADISQTQLHHSIQP